ncbi:MAG: hypothetical protein KKC84_04450 [Candidatus Omnitrophica bacterium]|nr:hypothetical protein [Candidatus Omnitrophota bacterium]
MRNFIKRPLFIVSAIALGILASLILGELILRFNPHPIFSRKVDFHYTYWDALGQRGVAEMGSLRPSSLLGYEHVPFQYSVGLRINSFGMVGKEYPIEKQPDTFRILLLGDSIAAQNGIREFLEERLNTGFSTDQKFQIWNAGVGSYDVRRYYLYLAHKGIHYDPDMAMIFFWLNDFDLNTFVYYQDARGIVRFDLPFRHLAGSFLLHPVLIKHSYLWRFLMARVEYMVSRLKGQKRFFLEEENGRFYLRKIQELCQQRGIPLYAVVFGDLKPWAEYKKYEQEQYATLCGVLRELNIPFLEIYTHIPEENLCGLKKYPADDIHPSREGENLIADVIYNWLHTTQNSLHVPLPK